MKRLLSVLFGIMMLLSISYGYTFTVDDGRSKLVNEIDSGNTVFVGLEESEETRFVVKEGDITLTEVTGETGIMQFSMPSENVWITLIRPGDIKIITATAGENGTISPEGRTSVVSGENQTFEMIPDLGYTIDYVLVDGVNVGDPTSYTFTDVVDFHTIEAVFKKNMFDVTLDQQSGSGGSTSVVATYGLAMPSITLPSRTGYTFGGYYTETNGGGTQYYKADGSSAKNWDKTAATTLYAKWTVNTYTVTLNNQSATTAGTTSVTATYGSAMPSITKPAKTGYTFGGYYTETNGGGTQYYKADGSSAKNWDKTAATTLYAKWTVNTYTITATAGSNGSISPSGSTSVTYGTDKTYTITANSGYVIQDVLVDGASVGNVHSYTFSAVETNHTISASFSVKPGAKSFAYTGGIQTYTVPATGVYKLETWGAGGYGTADYYNSSGWHTGHTEAGAGGYSMGYKKLTAGQVIYIGVGGTANKYLGGYNGGGNGHDGTAGGGGGATHMAFANGTLSQIGTAGNSGQVLLVAGGGGGGSYGGKWGIYAGNGGAGGGTEGGAGGNAAGGTQTSGAAFGQGGHNAGTHSVSGGWTVGCGGGGGGWYGGAAGWPSGGNTSSGGGGSGYIGGVASFTYNGTTYSPSTTQGGGAAYQNHGSAKITFIQ
ncbi:MAG: InlB B-repeat-containing protein [Clostridia bacterium]|nr:InlB B-repeat-containing protein [Clostridia bacterium]